MSTETSGTTDDEENSDEKILPADVEYADARNVLDNSPYEFFQREDIIHGLAIMRRDDDPDYYRLIDEINWRSHALKKSDVTDAIDRKFNQITNVGERKDVADMNAAEQAAYAWETIDDGDDVHILSVEKTDELFDCNDGIWEPKAHHTVREQATDILGDGCGSQVRNELVDLTRTKNVTPRDELGIEAGKIAVGNEVLALEDRTTEPLTPEHHATKRVPHEYDPDADYRGTLFFDTITEVVEDGCHDMVQEYAGYLLLANQLPHDKVMIFVGDGANGKSTIANVLRALVGEDNCISEDPKTLSGKQFSAYRLDSALANITNDINTTELGGDDSFMGIVSGDPMTVDQKYMEPFEIEPTSKHIYGCNELPKCGSPSPRAFYRRWIPVEFPNNYPAGSDERDPELSEKIKENEMSAVLNWALEGLERLQEQGTFSDNGWRDTKEKWRRLGDDFGAWLVKWVDEHAYHDHEGTSTEMLYNSYTAFVEKRNEERDPEDQDPGMGKRPFSQELGKRTGERSDKFYPEDGEKQVRGFKNLRLKTDP